jgi:uncharacterized radical SAM superfamily Fe-S cluster-containing enzyme
MNAALQPEPVEVEPDLRTVDAWSYHEADGKTDLNVIVSWCGRFTVVHYQQDGVYSAFRRYPREQRRMAEVIGTARDVAAAVDFCVLQAQHEAGA